MNPNIAIYLFVVGLTSGITLSLFFLRQNSVAISISTILVSLWTMSRMLGWASAEEFLFYGELIFAVYCCIAVLRAWKNTQDIAPPSSLSN